MLTGHPLTRHICAAQFDHSAERTHNALGSRPSVICKHLCVPNKCCHLVCHMSHPWLFSHAPSSMSTSSSSPAYPTTQREHSAHHALLQDHLVDKLRHQESLWREDLQSGGNPCTTTPTPSNSRCSLMCSSGKSLTKTRFTSLISKCSSGSAASLVSSSLCSPASSVAHCESSAD